MNSKETEIKEYNISELASKLEMSNRTIRYYEEIGLMNSVKRVDGGKRIYTDDDLNRLKLIKRLKILGLSLSQMQELEAIWSIQKSNKIVLKRLLELLDIQLLKIGERITDLEILRDEITNYRDRINNKLDV